MLVRFEVDACSLNSQMSNTNPERYDHTPSDDDLAIAMAGMSLLSQPAEERSEEDDAGPDIVVIPSGKLVPQSTLIELSTKSLRSFVPNSPNAYRGRGRGASSANRQATEEPMPDWDLQFPQLFLSGTPHYKFAVHERGQFRRVYEHTIRDDGLQHHLRSQQPSFNKLRVVLERIIDIVKEKGKDARLSLVYRIEEKRMELCERVSSKGCLPKLWLEKFDPIAHNSETEVESGENEETLTQESKE